jgi:chromosome segregation ATPase
LTNYSKNVKSELTQIEEKVGNISLEYQHIKPAINEISDKFNEYLNKINSNYELLHVLKEHINSVTKTSEELKSINEEKSEKLKDFDSRITKMEESK